jgi:hypothetical protein
MALEVNRFPARIFSGRRKAARLDWEAIEVAPLCTKPGPRRSASS